MCIKYSVKPFGRRTEFLGWSFSYTNNGAIFLNQLSLAQTTIDSAGLVEPNGRKTPYNSRMELTESQENYKIMMEMRFKYASIVGYFRYLAYSTGPDFAYITATLYKALQKPTARHWEALKIFFR